MKASDVMTVGAATIRSDASVPEAARLMLQYAISGLPVVDDAGRLVGIVTEGDFLRRTETGTERRHRPRWLEFLLGPGRLADEYVHSHSRKVEEVMTRRVVTVAEETPVDEIARWNDAASSVCRWFATTGLSGSSAGPTCCVDLPA
jgi:CBS domain-containing protein